ncbi:hypothetical protein DFH06DRAFT_1130545 [Mycena polygramma]|nr:hypothetical protein DFH06DRAFT_1130545 [Mycena polygramma]
MTPALTANVASTTSSPGALVAGGADTCCHAAAATASTGSRCVVGARRMNGYCVPSQCCLMICQHTRADDEGGFVMGSCVDAPRWRKRQPNGEWSYEDRNGGGKEWGPLYHWWVSRTLSLVASLYFWGRSVVEGDESGLRVWEAPVLDVTWMIEGMVTYYEMFKGKGSWSHRESKIWPQYKSKKADMDRSQTHARKPRKMSPIRLTQSALGLVVFGSVVLGGYINRGGRERLPVARSWAHFDPHLTEHVVMLADNVHRLLAIPWLAFEVPFPAAVHLVRHSVAGTLATFWCLAPWKHRDQTLGGENGGDIQQELGGILQARSKAEHRT